MSKFQLPTTAEIAAMGRDEAIALLGVPVGQPEIGTVIGTVPEGEILAGWHKVATGDGRYIVTKSGACFGREHDREIPTDLAWAAVSAMFAKRAEA